jgi:chromosome segregation ATPase
MSSHPSVHIARTGSVRIRMEDVPGLLQDSKFSTQPGSYSDPNSNDIFRSSNRPVIDPQTARAKAERLVAEAKAKLTQMQSLTATTQPFGLTSSFNTDKLSNQAYEARHYSPVRNSPRKEFASPRRELQLPEQREPADRPHAPTELRETILHSSDLTSPTDSSQLLPTIEVDSITIREAVKVALAKQQAMLQKTHAAELSAQKDELLRSFEIEKALEEKNRELVVKLTTELRQSQSQELALRAELEEEKNNNWQLCQKYNNLDVDLQNERSRVNELYATLKESSQREKECRATINSLSLAEKGLQDQIKNLRSHVDLKSDELQLKDVNAKKLQETIGHLEVRIKDLESVIQSNEQQKQQISRELERCRMSSNSTQNSIQQLQSDIDSRNMLIAEYEAQVSALNFELNSCRSSERQLKSESEKLSTSHRSLHQELSTLRSELEYTSQRLHESEKLDSAFRLKVSEQMKERDDELYRTKLQLKDSEHVLEALRRDHAMLKETSDLLSSRLQRQEESFSLERNNLSRERQAQKEAFIEEAKHLQTIIQEEAEKVSSQRKIILEYETRIIDLENKLAKTTSDFIETQKQWDDSQNALQAFKFESSNLLLETRQKHEVAMHKLHNEYTAKIEDITSKYTNQIDSLLAQKMQIENTLNSENVQLQNGLTNVSDSLETANALVTALEKKTVTVRE